jgi:hypothetical protein
MVSDSETSLLLQSPGWNELFGNQKQDDLKIKQLDFSHLIFLKWRKSTKAVKRSSSRCGLSREPVGGVNR